MTLRRRLLAAASLAAIVPTAAKPGSSVNHPEEWMDEVMSVRGLEGRLELSRFVEPMYFLLAPITWRRDSLESDLPAEVVVPRGFVTDLASIPRVFFSLLRPDGEYAHAAIVHDYLYWTQSTSRLAADRVFELAMRDLEVNPLTIDVLSTAVRAAGEAAWAQNAEDRRSGQHRILKEFPTRPGTRWSEWRNKENAFEDD
jgi:hypothetical protein